MAHSGGRYGWLAHGEHEGYVPGKDGNPKRKGKVHCRYNDPDHVRFLLSDLIPFTGHSMRAFGERSRYLGYDTPVEGYLYRVYSYETKIAQWFQPDDPDITPKAWIDMTQYSHITSTHQGYVSCYMGRNVDPDIALTPLEGFSTWS